MTNNIHWLLQDYGGNNEDYFKIKRALNESGALWNLIRVIPFSTELSDIPKTTLPTVVLGSITLCQLAKDKKYWIPGVWWNDNFNFEIQKPYYKKALLNYEAVACNFGNVEEYEGDRFIRPVDDGKPFAGHVLSHGNCLSLGKPVV